VTKLNEEKENLDLRFDLTCINYTKYVQSIWNPSCPIGTPNPSGVSGTGTGTGTSTGNTGSVYI
jgi:hypothetical protein